MGESPHEPQFLGVWANSILKGIEFFNLFGGYIMDYFSLVQDGLFCYTIDMIRIRTYLSISAYNEVRKFLFAQNAKFFHSGGGFGKFTENFQVDKLWIGLNSSSLSKEIRTWNNAINLTLEFNPNRATDRDWFFISWFLIKFDFSVIRFDLAVDIPKNINTINFANLLKKSYSVFYKSYNDKTYYFGKGDGHVKIYNKKIESGLDYELTRYEVTKCCDFDLKCNDLPFIKFNFLELIFFKFDTVLSGKSYDAILFAVNQGYPYKDLSRTYKSAIKKDYLENFYLNDEPANLVLRQLVAKLVGLSNKPS